MDFNESPRTLSSNIFSLSSKCSKKSWEVEILLSVDKLKLASNSSNVEISLSSIPDQDSGDENLVQASSSKSSSKTATLSLPSSLLTARTSVLVSSANGCSTDDTENISASNSGIGNFTLSEAASSSN